MRVIQYLTIIVANGHSLILYIRTCRDAKDQNTQVFSSAELVHTYSFYMSLFSTH